MPICVDFSKAKLVGTRLLGATLRHARFLNADLAGANFTNADVWNADFSHSVHHPTSAEEALIEPFVVRERR